MFSPSKPNGYLIIEQLLIRLAFPNEDFTND